MRTISSGKSAQFPVTAKANAAYHTPGTLLGTQTINHNEVVINIDDLLLQILYSNVMRLATIMIRAEYSRLLGMALAKQFDTQTMQVGVLAARASATYRWKRWFYNHNWRRFRCYNRRRTMHLPGAAEAMDEKDVPENDRVAIKPEEYYKLVRLLM